MGKSKGKAVRKNKKYSAEFKISVIMNMREHHLEYYETVRKYWNASKGREENYMSNVKRWFSWYPFAFKFHLASHTSELFFHHKCS